MLRTPSPFLSLCFLASLAPTKASRAFTIDLTDAVVGAAPANGSATPQSSFHCYGERGSEYRTKVTVQLYANGRAAVLPSLGMPGLLSAIDQSEKPLLKAPLKRREGGRIEIVARNPNYDAAEAARLAREGESLVSIAGVSVALANPEKAGVGQTIQGSSLIQAAIPTLDSSGRRTIRSVSITSKLSCKRAN